MIRLKRLWLAAVLTLCAGATASAYDLTVAQSEHGTVGFSVGGTAVTTAEAGEVVTVTVTPDAGWQTKTVTAQAYDTWGAAKARGSSRSIDILTVTPAGSGNTWTFTMPSASIEVSADFRKLLTHGDISVGNISTVTYNGQAQTPAVTVKDGNKTLTAGTDYTVSYSNNTNAGTAKVTITAASTSEWYAGTVTKTFTIAKAAISATATNRSYTYNGSSRTITVSVTRPTSGYTVWYSTNNSTWSTTKPRYTNAGTYRIYWKVTAANYNDKTGSATLTINMVTVTDGNISMEYGGNVAELTIHDMGNQQGSTVEEDLQVTALNYYRTLNGSNTDVYTVCLPYAPPVDDNLKYYTLAGAEGTTLQFEEITGAPQACTPYLVFAAATVDISRENFTEDFVMVKEVDNQSSADGYTMKGTLSGISHANAVGLYILQAGNRWAKVGSDTHAYLPPFRAYIVAADDSRTQLYSTFNDEATSINGIHTTDRDGTERWFDLSGHRIEAPVKAGIYVHNGRKEVVK